MFNKFNYWKADDCVEYIAWSHSDGWIKYISVTCSGILLIYKAYKIIYSVDPSWMSKCLRISPSLILSLSPSGTSRNARASFKAAERILQKLRGRTEFTLLLTLKQEKFSSGVLLSIHYGEQRYLSICLSVYLSVCLSVCPSVRPSVHPSIPSLHPSIHSISPSIHSFHLSIHPFIPSLLPSIHSISPSIHSFHLSIHPSIHPSISLSIYWAVCASILPVGFCSSKTFFLFFLFNLLFLRGTHNQFSWWNVCNTSDWGVHWHFLNTHSIDSTTSLRSALRVQAKRFTDHCSSSHSFKTRTFPWAALFPAALAHTRI